MPLWTWVTLVVLVFLAAVVLVRAHDARIKREHREAEKLRDRYNRDGDGE